MRSVESLCPKCGARWWSCRVPHETDYEWRERLQTCEHCGSKNAWVIGRRKLALERLLEADVV